ncbi:hypothetical protein F4804DRAFT_354133 [Jackrogersella minutella]|nr:hypothetical protein F4804DRAFT_354133 [Jackrogersella minutella]
MSSNERLTPSTTPTPSRVRYLSQHFNSLAQTEESNMRSPPTPVSDTNAEASSSVDAPSARQTVYTGEHRIPLRERLRKMRLGINERKEERRRSGYLPESLQNMVSSSSPPSPSPPPPAGAPTTPIRSRPAPLEPPRAPRKANRKSLHLPPPVFAGGCDEDDHLFDRRANTTEEEVASKRLSVDVANERSRKRITAPGAPSPLRASFNADEMARLGSELDEMLERERLAKEEAERAGRGATADAEEREDGGSV